jgi:hypothetical protein
MYTLKVERLVDAPAAVVWQVISDVEGYADYAPNLSRAHKISTGEFPARRCYTRWGEIPNARASSDILSPAAYRKRMSSVRLSCTARRIPQ